METVRSLQDNDVSVVPDAVCGKRISRDDLVKHGLELGGGGGIKPAIGKG